MAALIAWKLTFMEVFCWLLPSTSRGHCKYVNFSVLREFLGQNSSCEKKWAMLTIDFDLGGREVSEVVQKKE